MCIFDIDKTLTSPQCGTSECHMTAEARALDLIRTCKQSKMKLGINTARKQSTLHGVSPAISSELRNVPICHRNSKENVALGKERCMYELMGKNGYRGDKKGVVFMDDNTNNIEHIQSKGFTTVQVNPTGFGFSHSNHALAKLLIGFTSRASESHRAPTS